MKRIVAAFRRLNPMYSMMAAHPVFKAEILRLPYAREPEESRRLAFRRLAVSAFVTVLMWLLLAIIEQAFFQGNGDEIAVFGQGALLLMLGLSVLLGVGLDFASISNSVNSINGDIENGRWDLLRLTALNREGIVAAKHAASRMRVWRDQMNHLGIRSTLGVIGGIVFTMLIQRVFANGVNATDPFAYELFTMFELPSVFSGIFTFISAAAVFILEPFWRVRALTAFGLAVSAHQQNTLSAILVCGGALVGVWLTQLLMLISALVFTFIGAGFLMFGGFAGVLCAPGTVFLFMLVGLYGFYDLLARWGLRRATRQLLRMN
jgi:hypothetical protein